MTTGSLSPLSPKTQALLAAERDIVAQPGSVHRRALLRARAAMWDTRGVGVGSNINVIKVVRVVAVAALLTTSAVAAWLAREPATSGAPNPLRSAPRVSQPPPAPLPRLSKPALKASAPEADSSAPEADSPERDSPEPRASVATVEPAAQRVVVRNQGTASRKTPGDTPEELRLLDRARRALVAGDFHAALRFIQRHHSTFPNGQLSEEREALRVQALKGTGQSKQADRAASDFESRYPNSVLAPELSKDSRPAP